MNSSCMNCGNFTSILQLTFKGRVAREAMLLQLDKLNNDYFGNSSWIIAVYDVCGTQFDQTHGTEQQMSVIGLVRTVLIENGKYNVDNFSNEAGDWVSE